MAAVYLLVVQTLVSGIALGIHPGFLKLDDGAHIICSSAGAPSPARGPDLPADRSEHQICCILGLSLIHI